MADGTQTFNSPIETGVRALILLAESYPAQMDHLVLEEGRALIVKDVADAVDESWAHLALAILPESRN
jgi:hypothetical protein